MIDPYRRAGLRANPFLVDAAPGVPPALFVDTGHDLDAVAPAPGEHRFIQLIGDKGAGKTTHLLHWRGIHPGAYVHLPDGSGRFRWLPVTPICYWDEINKSPRFILHAALRLASARGATVVVGTHEDRSALPRRLGMAVQTIEFSAITADAVLRWATRRIEAAQLRDARSRAPGLVLSPEQAARVAARAGTSWRTVADELHVWAAAAITGDGDFDEPVRVSSHPVAVWDHVERDRGRRRRRVPVVTGAVFVVIALQCVDVTAQPQGMPAGSRPLQIHGTMDAPVIAPIIEAFTRIHPDVTIDYQERNSIELHARYLHTVRDGGATADLVMSSAIDLQMKLANDGHALHHDSVHAGALPRWAVWRSEAFAFSIEPVVMVFNRDRLEARLRPTSRYRLVELLRSEPVRFRSRVGTYDPARSGTGYLYLTQDIEQSPIVWELISALGQSDVQLFTTSRGIIDGVVSGRLLVGYNVVGSYALARAASEPSLEVLMPEDYTLVVARTAIISRHGRRPDLARRFLDYLLSREGQQVVSESSGLFPIRTDVEGESMEALSRRSFGGARAVQMGPGLLVYVDRLKRERVLSRWRDAMKPGVSAR